MSIAEMFCPNLSRKGQNTERLLERVPSDPQEGGWKPHENPERSLALPSHLCDICQKFTITTIQTPKLEIEGGRVRRHKSTVNCADVR